MVKPFKYGYIECEICGTTFLKKRPKHRFCKRDCQTQWQQQSKWEDVVGADNAAKQREDAKQRMIDDNPSKRPEVAAKISQSLKEHLVNKDRTGENNPFYGHAHTDEYKEWASSSRKGKRSYDDEGYEKMKSSALSGENHPNWKGGISKGKYPFGWDKKLKDKIKEKYNKQCMICGSKTQKLAVHHIDYDKSNIDEQNLIPLCFSCHSKTNYRRDSWIKFFDELLKNMEINQ